ncbi:hypothetical protein Angca_000414, partial [Angiostrongylus cantonensis]
LVSTLNSYQDEIDTPLDLPSEQTSRIEYITGRQNKIEQAKTTIEHDRNSLQTALDAYAIMADQLQLFWGAFNYIVHSRQMDDLQKMTYLLDALQGEAKECVKQYQIS